MRRYLFIILSCLVSLTVMADKSYTVVLDPGHGGKDPGAIGKFSKEKDLNLSLALQVGKLIQKQYPDIKVVYTRSTDVFIPLQERADIANKNNADLFISIHTNSAESKTPHGVETFILGTDRMEANLDVAMRENAVIKLESDYKTTYQGFDPNSIDSYIMFELMQNSYMDQSLRFAEQVQQRFVGHLNREDRGVRQAAFWVLLKTACPSILFEMGFISNPDEEKFLNKESSMAQMANALVNAFAAYTHREAVKASSVEAPKAESPAPAPAPAAEQPAPVAEKPAPQPAVEQPAAKPAELVPAAQPKQTLYAIQVCASKSPLPANSPLLKGQKCEYMKVGDWYKYYTAANANRAKVAKKLPELRKLFPDCWIITVEKE
jgi:N-acetylmuramoyl-L-alanine amidase